MAGIASGPTNLNVHGALPAAVAGEVIGAVEEDGPGSGASSSTVSSTSSCLRFLLVAGEDMGDRRGSMLPVAPSRLFNRPR